MSGDPRPIPVAMSLNACVVVMPMSLDFARAINIRSPSFSMGMPKDIALFIDSIRALSSIRPPDSLRTRSKTFSASAPIPSAMLLNACLLCSYLAACSA